MRHSMGFVVAFGPCLGQGSVPIAARVSVIQTVLTEGLQPNEVLRDTRHALVTAEGHLIARCPLATSRSNTPTRDRRQGHAPV